MAETDMYSKQMSLFDEGGMADDGMDVDPVSGNEVPPLNTWLKPNRYESQIFEICIG